MILYEIFNKPLSYIKTDKSSIKGVPCDVYEFTTSNNIKYEVVIYKINDFRMAGIDINDSGIGIDFKNLNVSIPQQELITGTGNEIEVFSTVLAIISKAIKNINPNIIAFGAHEKSRQKLYDRILKIMKNKFNYKLIDSSSIVLFSLNNSKYYVLSKN